jgi:hypothetical protein
MAKKINKRVLSKTFIKKKTKELTTKYKVLLKEGKLNLPPVDSKAAACSTPYAYLNNFIIKNIGGTLVAVDEAGNILRNVEIGGIQQSYNTGGQQGYYAIVKIFNPRIIAP